MFCTFAEYQESDFYARINEILAEVRRFDDKLNGLRYTLKTVKDTEFRKTLIAKIEALELERATLLKERDTLNAAYHKKIDEEKVKPKEEQKPLDQMRVEAVIEAKAEPVELTEAEVEKVIAVKVDPVLKKIEPEILEIVAYHPERIDYVADLLTEKAFEKVVAEIEQKAAEAETEALRPEETLYAVPMAPVVTEGIEKMEAGFSIGKFAMAGLVIASLFTVLGKKR